MKLYYAPGACSLSPHIVACEAGIDLELDRVDFASKKTESGRDFAAINPKGYVPALELDDGQLLTEGAAIVQYLADRKPESGLAPANGTLERYRLQEALGFIGSEIHKSFAPLFNPQLPEASRALAIGNLRSRFALTDSMLDGKSYLLGESFTAADAYLFVMTGWLDYLKIDAGELPNVRAHQQRVAARPAVQQALREEGLIS